MTASRLNIAIDQDGLVLPDSGQIAVLRARSPIDHDRIARERLRLFNSFRPEFDRLDALDYPVAADFSGQYAASMVEITRSKAETLGLVAMATMATDPGGIVLVDGAKTDGIDSVLKHCKALFQPISVVAKSHGKLFWFTRPENLPLALTEWRAHLTAKRNPAGYFSAPGMFSPDKADPGSALLAVHFDDRLAGEVADLGAGWGWLADQALKQSSAISRLDLYEAEKTALKAARANITDARAEFHWADVASLDITARYDAVISNPPFHQGRAAEPDLGAAFIAKAAAILKPKGQLWLVANRQLPYESVLAEHFAAIRPLEETHHFKVILASRPLSGSSRRVQRNFRRAR